MTEQIGKVILDLSKYPGQDYYSDGAVEDELLQIVRNHGREEYARIIEERKSWPLLYHLSHQRENIVSWLPIARDWKVLEVGSGCGAVTGALAEKAGSVTCVDLSKKRSSINAWRHRDCDNVRIHVGNFKDIEPELDSDFDLICLIGVFEYGQGYIGGETPYEDFLQILLKHLKRGGRIVIAIENKYGLKYFAGCREDHSGGFFEGIENYNRGGVARTFSRKGLEKIFARCGVEEYHFYYPYPDYKFMSALYSDERGPGKGELSQNLRNFDRDRLLLFDEQEAFDGLLEDDLFALFSNSYLVVLGGEFPVKYVKYSNDRGEIYRIRTEIRREVCQGAASHTETAGQDVSGWQVVKCPLTRQAQEHVRTMEAACGKLRERYQGSPLEINACTLRPEADRPCAVFEYVEGTPLSGLMDACLERGDSADFYRLFDQYVGMIGYGGNCGVTDLDLIFSNILVCDDRWVLIDYEWTFDKRIPAAELAYRAAYHYLLEGPRRADAAGEVTLEDIRQRLGLTGEQAQAIIAREQEFQREVKGERQSLAEMYASFGAKITVPQGNGFPERIDQGASRVQVYEDWGEGYSEEHSYLVSGAYRDTNLVELELTVAGGVKMLRIDPMMSPCVCRVLELNFNGKPVSPRRRGHIVVNGRKTVVKNKETGLRQLSFIFPTEDPNINIAVHKLNPGEHNRLTLKLEVAGVPLGVARELAGAVPEQRDYFI